MSAPLTITFAQAHKAGACEDSYRKMAESLGGITAYGRTKPVPIEKVLDVCGLSDAIWAMEAIGANRELRLFAADCAERVLPIFEAKCPDDDRPRTAIEASRAYARGEIDDDYLSASVNAARDAARDAAWNAARDAAWNAARDAAWAAAWAAWAAAWAAARAAARDAARKVEWNAAWNAARVAAWAAAWAAEREWQDDRLRVYLRGES